MLSVIALFFFFFFQAEDGIRDLTVTGVQTCALPILQRARDEAHRFAVSYSRKRRAERTITSELLAVPGIGPTRRRALLERFGSLAGVKTATPAEIAALPGFSTRLAERILERLKMRV